MTLISRPTQSSPTLGEWDFDLTMDPAMFQLTRTYYLEATVALVFSNTGVLTRSLRIPLGGAVRSGSKLRSALSRAGEVMLVALDGRQAASNGSSPQTQAVGSNTFVLRAAISATTGTIPTISAEQASSTPATAPSTAMIAAVAGGVGAAVAVAAALVVVAVIRRRRHQDALTATDAPLQTAPLPSTSISNDLYF